MRRDEISKKLTNLISRQLHISYGGSGGGGGGGKEWWCRKNFFRYEIPRMNFSLALMSHTGEEALHSSMSKKNNFN